MLFAGKQAFKKLTGLLTISTNNPLIIINDN